MMAQAPDEKEREKAARVRDAASLVVLRFDGSEPRVLMGRRAGRHQFMPNKWVFPGGAIEPGDYRIAPASPLSAATGKAVAETARLARQNGARLSQALALAAVRETFEETGLILGKPFAGKEKPGAENRQGGEGWHAFLAAGYRPTLGGLRYIARAITPPRRVRRYDARFFLADAGALASLDPWSSAELPETGWFTFADIAGLEVATITRTILSIVERHARGTPPETPPVWRWR